MSERENNVYKAKLAEQAERYDGELNGLAGSESPKLDLKTFRRRRRPDAAFTAKPTAFLSVSHGAPPQ